METTTFIFSRLRRGVAGLLLGACALMGASAMAQGTWPSKPIRVIVPLQAGSAADVAARAILAKIGQNTGQSFVIENMAGASGLIGADYVVRAAPDGYTLGAITDSVLNYAVNLSRHVNFDPVNDFAPISQMVDISWVLVANSKFQAKTVPQLVAMAKAQPGKIDFASAGVGSPHHIAMELFASQNGISLWHVPYKGATEATTDVASGRVPLMFSAVSVVLPFIQEGRLRALAQPNDTRSVLLPQVPTFAEAGIPAFRFSTWLGLYAPKGTPKAIVDKLNAEVAKAVADPGVHKNLVALGLDPVSSTPEALGTLTRDGYARVRKAVHDAGIQPQ